jgi:hypothetical protein
MSGTYQTATVHMAGLKKLVDLRGGLQAFNHNDILQRLLTWSAIISFEHKSVCTDTPAGPILLTRRHGEPL